MTLPLRRLSFVALFLCPACSAPNSGPSDTTGPATTSTSDAPIDCEQYVSTNPIGPAVTVTVRQESIGPVYFYPEGCGGALVFDITSVPGEERVLYGLGDCSPVLCDDFRDAPDCFPSCPNCAPPGSARLEPAGMGEGVWSGASLVPFQMPEACASGSGCQETCQRQDQAPAGRYQIALTVYHLCTGGCECEEAPANGLCNLYGGVQLSYPETFITEIDYPAQTAAEIVIID